MEYGSSAYDVVVDRRLIIVPHTQIVRHDLRLRHERADVTACDAQAGRREEEQELSGGEGVWSLIFDLWSLGELTNVLIQAVIGWVDSVEKQSGRIFLTW